MKPKTNRQATPPFIDPLIDDDIDFSQDRPWPFPYPKVGLPKDKSFVSRKLLVVVLVLAVVASVVWCLINFVRK